MNCKTAQKWIDGQEVLPRRLEELPAELRRHVTSCTRCAAELSRHLRAQEWLERLRRPAVPGEVMQGYAAGVQRKLETELGGKRPAVPRPRREIVPALRWLRPAVALAAIAVAAAGIWWFVVRSSPPSEMAASDSLEYYLESFDEESASNPVAVVKGMEYEWAYYNGGR